MACLDEFDSKSAIKKGSQFCQQIDKGRNLFTRKVAYNATPKIKMKFFFAENMINWDRKMR